MHVGRSFRRCREAVGLTQEQAAARAGITRIALTAPEKKPLPNPSLKTVLRLVRAYDLDSVEALLGPVPSVRIAAAWNASDTQ
ncbi:helix-turn-helix transcriptional regulator [Mycobacterium avium]|uniref:helix-turn-helix transcriptional regulator n=1 Tax=Mycobacterium avium TaxID=1764 RepID=UPI000AC68ACD|nr:helix-turn-helix transcriptional regulator [Mycobacterium avium]